MQLKKAKKHSKFLMHSTALAVVLALTACSSGGGDGANNPTGASGDPIGPLDTDAEAENPSGEASDPDAGGVNNEPGTDAGDTAGNPAAVLDPFSDSAVYNVTVRNFWGAEQFPQEFPDEAHLSLWGGATHNAGFSLWSLGEPPSRGLEDVAEAGLIDILLFDEIAPAVQAGTADSLVEVRVFTDPAIGDSPGILEFEITVNNTHPLLSMVSMLGPSPDWFVGVDGLSMMMGDAADTPMWVESMTVPMPLYDGGSKSDIIPVMGGPDIIPPNPVGLVAYDSATGTYLPSTSEQIVGELVFTRTR